MNYKLHTLSSGLRVLTVPMLNLESATVAVWVKTGSRNEGERVGGISHFLEHMVFKGSKKRPSAKQISGAVDSIGGEFNAATSKDWTSFYIKTSINNIETAFDVLSDMVLDPLLKEEEIEREKGTIIQEIAMYEDTPTAKIGEVFENVIFAGSSLARDTAGTAESVKRIAKNDFLRYRKRHYYPENMLISIAGGVSEIKVLELVKKYFEFAHLGGGFGHPRGVSFVTNVFEPEQTKPQIILKTKKEEQAHFILGFLADGRNYKGRYAQGLLSAILGGSMSSRLWIEVRERRGLAYAVRTSIDRYTDTGYLGTYAGVDPVKVDEAIKVILDELRKITNHQSPITSHELKDFKEFLKGHFALALEETKDVSSFFADQVLFMDEILTPEEIFKKVDSVTLEEVNYEAKRLFIPSRLNLAIIGDYNNEAKFEKLLK
ncbi:MAG: pitrilysin family protein [Patescibacteria group bacterium]